MRIISYNIRFGGKGRENLIAQVLQAANPDVVILVEAYNPHIVQTIAQQLGFPHIGARKSYSAAFLSKIPPISYQWHALRRMRTPFLEVEFENNISILGIHLSSLLTRWREQRRVQEIRQLLEITAKLRTKAHLMIGDFNAVAPDDTVAIERMPFWLQLLIRLSGGLHCDALETLQAVGYIDVFRHLHPEETGYTLPPPDPNTRLDYAFVPISLIDSVRDCRVIRSPDVISKASDHYPLFIEMDAS